MDSNTTVFDAEWLNDKLRKTLLPVTIYVGTEAVLGFFGNLVVLVVFKFRYHACNFRYFVLCLALTDMIASCTAISGEVVTQLYWYIYPFPAICKIKSFFNVFTVFAEAFCLLTIAVDRFRKVCRPIEWQISPRVAMFVCYGIYFVSTIVALPVAIYWGTHTKELNRTYIDLVAGEHNVTNIRINVTLCEIDQKFLGTSHPRYYTYSLETLVTTTLIPMFILYIFVARSLVRISRLKKKLQAPSTIQEANKPKLRYDNKSDIDYTTDEEGSFSTSNTIDISVRNTTGMALPVTLTRVKLEHTRLNTSTANSMTTAQTGAHPDETPPKLQENHSKPKSAKRNTKVAISRVRRKTLIMFILTVVFIFTTVTYLTMLGLIAGNILESLSNSQKAAYFFFFRFYFINHVINPLVYGLLDPQFRRVVGEAYQKMLTKFGR